MQIIIDKAKASIKNSDFVTTGCRNYIQVDFTFSEDWNDLIKTAVFYFDCKEDNKITAIIENDKCFLPTMGDVKIINIGVYGETAGENEIRISTNFVKVEVKQGAYDENAHPQYDDFYSYIQSNNIKYIRKNSGNIEYSTDGQEWFVCGGESNPFFYKTKIKPYLYTTIYETFDFDYAKQYIDSHYHNYNGACSTVSNGNFVGRNLDWYYDEEATFVIRASRSQSRYASIGTASGIKELTDNFANSNENSDLYKVLPYFMQDGINEKSVYCNINVVPAGDKGLTSGTTPLISQRLSISGVMLVRYILDNFATAKSAVEYIRDYVSVYGLKTISGVTQEFHFLVRDLTNTYILEFVNNALVILSSTDSDFTPIPNNKDIMTNFYLSGWNGQIKSVVMGDTQAEVQATGLTDHAMGLERYNIASSAYSTLSTKEDMVDLMTNQLKYSKTYQSATNPFWHSEYNAQYQTFGNVTIYSRLEDYQDVEEYSINKFQHRSREEGSPHYGTWHTAHTSVYDIVDKKLYLYVQEEIGEYEGNIVIDLTQETRVSVSATGTATDEVRYITVDGVEKKLAGGDVSSVNGKTGDVVLEATDIKLTTNQQTVEENFIRIDETLNTKQNTTDNSLGTTSKSIVGAINEINNNVVHRSGNENIEGTKNFVSMPNVLESSPIPEGYTELTSIISNGTQRIDTGHIPTRNLKVYIEYIPLNSDDVTVFGAILNGSQRVNFNTAGSDVAYRAFDSTKRTISNVQTVGQVSRVLFDLHDGVYNINGNTGTLTIGDGYVSSYSLYLFALNAGSGSAAFNSSIELLKCQIWDDSNVLKLDLIPSKNSSNAVGLYDQENDNFLQGEIAHPFVAGSIAYNAKPLAKFEDIDEEIDDRIITSIDSSSTDDDIPSAKAVYDIIGDIESILASIDSGNGGV